MSPLLPASLRPHVLEISLEGVIRFLTQVLTNGKHTPHAQLAISKVLGSGWSGGGGMVVVVVVVVYVVVVVVDVEVGVGVDVVVAGGGGGGGGIENRRRRRRRRVSVLLLLLLLLLPPHMWACLGVGGP